MLNRAEKLGVNPGQLCQHAGVKLVALAVVLVDRPELPGIGHQAGTSARFKQSTDPRAVRADLNSKKSSLVFVRQLSQLFLIIGHRLFAKDVSVLVSNAHVVFLIAEIDADYRSELFSVRIYFCSFHKMTRSQAAGAASTPSHPISKGASRVRPAQDAKLQQ
jgi:hypothetical protein